jgi:hypothetical protein
MTSVIVLQSRLRVQPTRRSTIRLLMSSCTTYRQPERLPAGAYFDVHKRLKQGKAATSESSATCHYGGPPVSSSARPVALASGVGRRLVDAATHTQRMCTADTALADGPLGLRALGQCGASNVRHIFVRDRPNTPMRDRVDRLSVLLCIAVVQSL